MIRSFLLCFFALSFYSQALLAGERTPLLIVKPSPVTLFSSTVKGVAASYEAAKVENTRFDFVGNKKLLENALLTVSEAQLSTCYHDDYGRFFNQFRLDLMSQWCRCFCCCFSSSKSEQTQFEDRLRLAKEYQNELNDRYVRVSYSPHL